MPNENDQNNGFTSRFYTSTPVEGGEPLVERYDIEALRLVDADTRMPANIGDSTHPVYFLEGKPTQCEGGGGSGGGGSDVAIYPKYKGGTLIANFSVDGQNGRIYSPTVSEVYKKVTLWPPAGSTSTFSEVGDNNNSNPFKTMIGSYEFLLIHYAPSNNLSEERTMMLDAQSLKGSLPNNAIFSCHYLSDVFIKCQFTSQDKFEVIESEGIPLNTEATPTMLKCAIKKIEGLQFGASGEDLDQGLTVKQVLWDGIANQLGTYTFKTGTVESFNYIYLHFYASNNQYEERILVIDQEAVISGLAQDPSEAYFTCDISDDLYIKGKFIDINKFTITEVHTKTVDETVVVPILCQIDGICLGSVGSGGGGDTSDCMKKGIDYVTAGHNNSVATSASGIGVTEEGYKTIAYGNYSHAEGVSTCAVGRGDHVEGRYTTAFGGTNDGSGGAHAEGYETYATGLSHTEGIQTSADGGGSHAEGLGSYAGVAETTMASHAEGLQSTALGIASHAEGSGTYSGRRREGAIAGTSATHAEGYKSTAIGSTSHAEGYKTYISEKNSHAEGYKTCVYGENAHAEGASCYVKGNNSHAEGNGTTSYGLNSHAGGLGTYSMENQTVIGKYNSRDTSNNYAFIIGGGTSSARSNLFTVGWDGAVTAKGAMSATAFNQTSSRKVKENIKDMSKEEAEKLLQLKPVSFDYIKGEGNKNCYGLIAEEVQEVGINYPVFKGTMKTSSEECLQLDYTKFVPYLIKMIQIQEERINNLEKELERKGVK